MTPTRILLIDDHAMLRTGLRLVLNAGMQNIKIFEACSLAEAMAFTVDRIDVVLLDIKLPGLNGLEGIALLKRKWPQAPILMLSAQDDPETRRLALARGAADFISKTEAADVIVESLISSLSGPITAQHSTAQHSTAQHSTEGGCRHANTRYSICCTKACRIS